MTKTQNTVRMIASSADLHDGAAQEALRGLSVLLDGCEDEGAIRRLIADTRSPDADALWMDYEDGEISESARIAREEAIELMENLLS